MTAPHIAPSVEVALTRAAEVTTLHVFAEEAVTLTLDPRVVELPALRSVSFGTNRPTLERIDGLAALAQVPTLRELSISVHSVVPIEDAFHLAQLERLTLHGPWSSLPDTIGGLRRLTALELSLPRLQALPSAIGSLRALKSLSLRGCRLEALPESIGELTSLVDLYAESNRLRALPEGVLRLGALERLLLGGNALSEIPAGVGALPRLRVLDLTENVPLATVPSALVRTGLSLEIESEKLPAAARDAASAASEAAFAEVERAAAPAERPAWTLVLEGTDEFDPLTSSLGGPCALGEGEATPVCGVCLAPLAPWLQVDLGPTTQHRGVLQVWGCGETPTLERLRAIAETDVPHVEASYREHLRAFFAHVPEAEQAGVRQRAQQWRTTHEDRALLARTRAIGNALEYTLRFECRQLASAALPHRHARIVEALGRAGVSSPRASGPAPHRIVSLERHADRPALAALELDDAWALCQQLEDARRAQVEGWTLAGTKLFGHVRGDVEAPACPRCGQGTALVASLTGSGALEPLLEGATLYVFACARHPDAVRLEERG